MGNLGGTRAFEIGRTTTDSVFFHFKGVERAYLYAGFAACAVVRFGDLHFLFVGFKDVFRTYTETGFTV
jgi:hypothetical protein